MEDDDEIWDAITALARDDEEGCDDLIDILAFHPDRKMFRDA